MMRSLTAVSLPRPACRAFVEGKPSAPRSVLLEMEIQRGSVHATWGWDVVLRGALDSTCAAMREGVQLALYQTQQASRERNPVL